ncbi:MAG: hypothetical protein K8F91_22260, partial [Candidatus Obscuribacterales bacterium]|nr:hypothetical protein [Candidatus Obscuribacterales bacterium]
MPKRISVVIVLTILSAVVCGPTQAQTAGLGLPKNELQSQTDSGVDKRSENTGPPSSLPVIESSKTASVLPGPLQARRQKVLSMIDEARLQGVGTKIYVQAFEAVESLVKSGGSEVVIAGRLDSIENSLSEQFKRRHILKFQKPTPPVAATSPPPSQMANSQGRKSGPDKDSLIEALTDKWFGGDLPDSVKKK